MPDEAPIADLVCLEAKLSRQPNRSHLPDRPDTRSRTEQSAPGFPPSDEIFVGSAYAGLAEPPGEFVRQHVLGEVMREKRSAQSNQHVTSTRAISGICAGAMLLNP